MKEYSTALNKLIPALNCLLSLKMEEVEKISCALHETLAYAKRYIPNKIGKDIINKIESKVNRTKIDPAKGIYFLDIHNMNKDQRQEIVDLIFELYNHVAEQYYKNWYKTIFSEKIKKS